MGIFARVSTAEQQSLPMQLGAIKKYVRARKWKVVMVIEDVGSGVSERRKPEQLMRAARRRNIDTIIVWKLDRWVRSLHDLVATLQELSQF